MVPAKIHVTNHDPGEREASVPGVEGEPRPDNRLPAVMSSARAGKDPRASSGAFQTRGRGRLRSRLLFGATATSPGDFIPSTYHILAVLAAP